MSSIEGRRIEVREGNSTLLKLISGALAELGISVETPEESELDEPLADLLLADVDSGVPALDDRLETYRNEGRPVIHCGVRVSRERYDEIFWLERPFTRFQLYEMVVDVLEIDRDEVEAILADPVSGLDAATESDLSEPITRELDGDEALEIEQELGLEPGTIDDDSGDLTEGSDATYVLDPDSEAFLVVDVGGEAGGTLAAEVSVRKVDDEELRKTGDEEIVQRGFRSPTFNQTMPETPAALDQRDESTREASIAGDAVAMMGATDVGTAPELDDVETGPLRPDPVKNDVASQFRGVALSLAESWERIALTARTEDRANQIERILRAALSRGVKGASEEIMRLPQSQGFSGNLEAMPAIDLLRTVRDRRLRGRLEIASHQQAYVLYLDAGSLEEIDVLSGGQSSDDVLLEILSSSGAIDPTTYQDLRDSYASGEMMMPLEHRLIGESIVTEGALKEARSARAKAFFRQICSMRRGQFAFIEVRPNDGNPWPVEPLRLSVDSIMLELLREASFDTGDSRATSRTRLVLDPARAAAVRPSALTESERRVLELFRDAETVGQAREILAKAPPDEVDRIVNRMKQLEILKRSDPLISVPEQVREAGNKHTSDTVVSDIADVIGHEQARRTPGSAKQRAAGTEETEETAEAPRDEAETEQKATFDLGIVADRLEDSDVESLVNDGIAAYEESASESESEDEDDQS